MSLLDIKREKIEAYFSDWIQHVDDQTNYTLDSFPIGVGVIAEVTKPHCVLCVTVNKCIFKNEENKKPLEKMHPNCHCKQLAIENPNIWIDMVEGKKVYVMADKGGWLNAMGYTIDDKEEVANLIMGLSKQSFLAGNYYKRQHDNYGFLITINIDMPGKNEKQGKIYKLESGYMIHPNGRLRNVTPIGGEQK